MTASLDVVKVERGSVLVLRGVDLKPDVAADFIEKVKFTVGHSKFVLLDLSEDGDMEVWGPDVDLSAKIRQLLRKEKAGAAADAERARILAEQDDDLG